MGDAIDLGQIEDVSFAQNLLLHQILPQIVFAHVNGGMDFRYCYTVYHKNVPGDLLLSAYESDSPAKYE